MSLIECRTLFGEKKSIPAERISFRPSVYGIIVRENQVLFVNMRSTGKLFLPGGGSEVGELTVVKWSGHSGCRSINSAWKTYKVTARSS